MIVKCQDRIINMYGAYKNLKYVKFVYDCEFETKTYKKIGTQLFE